MKVLSKDDFYSLQGKGRSGAFQAIKDKLEELEVGQGVLIEKADWNNKIGPNHAINQYYRTGNKAGTPKRFATKTLPDNAGWAVLRLK